MKHAQRICLGALFACLQSASGQNAIIEPPAERRISVGGRLSILNSAAISEGSLVRATSSPAYRTELTTSWTTGRMGGGPAVHLRLNRRLGVSVDLLHRGIGYQQEVSTTSGTDDTSTTVDERLTTTSESTSADYWELPVMARIYYGRRSRGNWSRFFGAGFSLRQISDIRTTRETTIAGESCCDETPASPAHKRSFGLIAGAGVQVMDEIGLKITPEIRYTHWLRHSFDSPPTRSNRNQVEVLIGITF